MATLQKDTNKTPDWKLYPNSSDFSGMAQNECDNAIYLYVVAKGGTPAEDDGIILEGGVGNSIPVTIPDTEELHYKPVNKGPVTMRLG